MKLYQEKQETVNKGIEIINLELLYEKACNGILQLSMFLGIEAMLMMFEDDVGKYAGPKGKHKTTNRTGYRHGYEQATVVMGGNKIRAKRSRVRSLKGDSELPLPTLAHFQQEDPLNEAIMARLLADVSTMEYCRTTDVQDTIYTSKGEVSQRFI